jgi:phage/plasmid-like protein (TIGR03299 family)
MAHELEIGSDGQARMFFVGDEVPWHGLGRQLKSPPTVEEGIIYAGLDWKVERKQLVFADDHSIEAPAFATVRQSDGNILGVVGTEYHPLQNIDAFKWFQPWLDSGQVTLDTAGSLKGGRHVWVLATIKRDPTEVVKGDPLIRRILLSNSHDGTRMARAGFTATRCVCWNTVSAALTSKQSKLLKVRHTKNIEETLKDIQETMNVADRNFEATLDQMRAMARHGVTKDTLKEYVTRIFRPKPVTNDADEPMTEDQEERCDRIVGNIIPLFEHGKGNDMPGVKGTLWGAYNAVTEYLTWHRGRNADNRLTSLWFGDGQAVGQRAFDEARKMVMAA